MSFEQTAGRMGWLGFCIIFFPVLVIVFAFQELSGTFVPSSTTVRNQMSNYQNMIGTASPEALHKVYQDIKEMQAARMKQGYDPVYDCKLSENASDRGTYAAYDYQALDPLYAPGGQQKALGALHDGFTMVGKPQQAPAVGVVTAETLKQETDKLKAMERHLGDESLRLLQKQKDTGHILDADMKVFYNEQAKIEIQKAKVSAMQNAL